MRLIAAERSKYPRGTFRCSQYEFYEVVRESKEHSDRPARFHPMTEFVIWMTRSQRY